MLFGYISIGFVVGIVGVFLYFFVMEVVLLLVFVYVGVV